MIRYVLGFMFSYDLKQVVMIEKQKGPSELIGKWNGIGGKIEESDRWYIDAMVREFEEETSVITEDEAWKYYGKHLHDNFEIYAYAAKGNMKRIKSNEEETVTVFDVDYVLANEDILCPNVVSWITKAIERLQGEHLFVIDERLNNETDS